MKSEHDLISRGAIQPLTGRPNGLPRADKQFSDQMRSVPGEFQIKQMEDILNSKLVKRGIELGHLEWGKIETANQRATQIANVREGIDKDLARKIVKLVKDSKLKVQAAIQGDQVRVSGKKRDDLQQVMSLLKNAKLELPLQYINFRD